MKLGIRFSDNDFTSYIRGFFEMFIVPTFKEVEPGHFTTYLTSAMIVELFNTHLPYVHRFMAWYYTTLITSTITQSPIRMHPCMSGCSTKNG